MIREAGEAEEAGGEVFWLVCLIMVNHPDLISRVLNFECASFELPLLLDRGLKQGKTN
jgi:hypothetical protein